MEDMAPALLKKIQSAFHSKFEKSGEISELYSLVRSGEATYKQAQDFAVETGKILSEVFAENISSGILPNGKLYYNIAERIIPPMLKNNYNLTADIAKEVQNAINRAAGLNITAVKPELNRDKVNGIIDIVSGADKYDDISYMLRDPIVNFTQCVVDDTVKANADVQYKAGLSPKIVRTSIGKCCEWCSRITGTYDYESVKNSGNNVFRRHKNCNCLVEFVVDKQVQNVHSKRWADEGDIGQRIANATVESKKIVKRTKAQAASLQTQIKKQSEKAEG